MFLQWPLHFEAPKGNKLVYQAFFVWTTFFCFPLGQERNQFLDSPDVIG